MFCASSVSNSVEYESSFGAVFGYLESLTCCFFKQAVYATDVPACD
jgi:hypothetical protein